jgi:multimeric flavodoxin WrbA
MKKVVAINSSKRKKNTYGLINSAQSLFSKNDIELKILNLYEFDINDCNGCESCVRSGRCPICDGVAQIMEELSGADGIIISSPVYMAGVSGKLKTFIDRTCSWYHRPPLVSKPVLLVATTAGGYAKDVLKYMEKVAVFWGANPCGKIYRTAGNLDTAITEKESADFISALKYDRQSITPSLNALLTFQVQKVLALKILPIDSEHWKNQNWHKQIYYFKCKIPLYKSIIAKSFYAVLNKVIKPV